MNNFESGNWLDSTVGSSSATSYGGNRSHHVSPGTSGRPPKPPPVLADGDLPKPPKPDADA